MNKNNIMPWALVTINASALFYLSSQPIEKSRETSSKVTEIVMETIEEIAPNYYNELDYRDVHRGVRKSAHFTLYLMLGYLVSHAMKKEKKEKLIYSLLMCSTIALMDESYQYFIPGRGAEITDVFIDTLGSATGIGLNTIIDEEKPLIKRIVKTS